MGTRTEREREIYIYIYSQSRGRLGCRTNDQIFGFVWNVQICSVYSITDDQP